MSVLLDQIDGLKLHLRVIAGMDTIMAAEKYAHVDAEMIDMMRSRDARMSR